MLQSLYTEFFIESVVVQLGKVANKYYDISFCNVSLTTSQLKRLKTGDELDDFRAVEIMSSDEVKSSRFHKSSTKYQVSFIELVRDLREYQVDAEAGGGNEN